MTVEQVLRAYKTKVSNNAKLRKLSIGAKNFADVEAFAKGSGLELVDVLQKFGDLENLSEDDLFAVLDACLQANHADVAKVAAKVQRIVYDAADVGIGVLQPEYNRMATRALVEKLIDGTETFENLKNLIVKESLSASDETIRKNSAAADNMGLKCRIVRKYDGVGVHNRKDPCEWCLAREGEWDNYAEALAAGAFERHPGCGCYIEYIVGKTRTYSTSAGAWNDL